VAHNKLSVAQKTDPKVRILYIDIDPAVGRQYPRQPMPASSMAEVKRMFDGYDSGIRYADEHVGKILAALADLKVLDEMAILIPADRGEDLGELNVCGDHQTADQHTCRVPCILKWPGVKTGVDAALHYEVDVRATILERLKKTGRGDAVEKLCREL
jgi:arylsulfatase A-like enzyme